MRSRPRSLPVLLATLLVAGLLVACGGGDDTAAGDTAAVDTGAPETSAPAPTDAPTTTEAPTTTVAAVGHLRGTAYTFNTPDPIAGATIKVVELPDVSAVTGADGSYELEVPAGATVTPYIEAEGHFGIHHQTFTVSDDGDGLELDGVNFQTPSTPIYDGLKALVGGFTGKDPFEGGCVIVTTVGDPRMVGMSFDEFIEFHPHGLAGATVAIDPLLATPIYFNDDVLPDQAQQTTSIDGGVLWPNVPPGEYTLTATLEGHEFATVHARCEDGWVVNANPVWGLHATS
ncbi:MAG: hypothetical protein RL238_92 [Actinomycetota bacterium]|jgi:hypothetical protein